MKRFAALLILAAFLGIILHDIPQAAAAGNDNKSGVTISAESFGACGYDEEDDRLAIQNALNYARYNATAENPVTVTVGDGTYLFSDSLLIYSHTRLILSDGAVFGFWNSPEGVILQGGHGKNVGYDNLTDVVISGGTWRGNAAATGAHTELIGFKCASDITITGLRMEDSSDHFIMLTGTRDAVVRNCSFSGHVSLSSIDQFTKEAVHIDFLPMNDEKMFPSKNITVEDCAFDRVSSGVGTHHYGYGSYETNITVRRCTFTGLLHNCINSYSITGLSVNNCRAFGCESFLWMRCSQGSFDSDSISDCGYRCFLVQDGSCFRLTNSVIRNINGPENKPIAVLASDSAALLEGNSISNVSGVAVRVKNSDRFSVIRRNIISDAEEQGIFVSDTSAFIEDNIISDCKGIWADNCKSEIRSNIVSRCYYGISDHTGTSHIYNNTVRETTGYGIKITGSEEKNGSSVVEGNSIALCGKAAIRVGTNCSGCVIRDNCAGQPFELSYSKWSGIEISGNGENPPPDTPSVRYSVDGNGATLKWDKVNGAAYYVVCEVSGDDDSLIRLAATGENSYRLNYPVKDEKRVFLVLSVGADGSECFYTIPSNSVRIRYRGMKKEFKPFSELSRDSAKNPVIMQSGNITVTEDGIASLGVAAEKEYQEYRWYFRKKGFLGWCFWKGHASPWESVIAAASWDGAEFLSVVSDGVDKYSALPVTISVNRPLRIVSEPADVRAFDGDEVKFLLKAAGSAKRHYQWYYKKAGAAEWSVWKGHNEPLLVAVANESWQDMQVKCIVTDDNGGKVESRILSVRIIQPEQVAEEYPEEQEASDESVEEESCSGEYNSEEPESK